MKEKKPLIVFFVPEKEVTEQIKNDSKFWVGNFAGLLEVRISTKEELKDSVMQCVGNSETVVGIITEVMFDWKPNIPVLSRIGVRDFTMQQEVAHVVELWGVKMLKTLQIAEV